MNPLQVAERAVLGAILLAPRQLDRLGWLRTEDFEHPAHGALLTAFRRLADAGHPALQLQPPAPVPLAWLNDVLEVASREVRGLSPAYVHALASACPRTGHAPVYGRMVLEGAIRRTVLQQAKNLEQRAHGSEEAEEPDAVLQQVDAFTDALSVHARRWGIPPRPASQEADAPSASPTKAS